MKRQVRSIQNVLSISIFCMMAAVIGCGGGGGSDSVGNKTDFTNGNTVSGSAIPSEIQGDWKGEATKVLETEFPNAWVISLGRATFANMSVEFNLDSSGALKGESWMYHVNICPNPFDFTCLPIQIIGGFELEGNCFYENSVLNCTLKGDAELDGAVKTDGSMDLVFLSANDNSPFMYASVRKKEEKSDIDVSGEYRGSFYTNSMVYEGTYEAEIRISGKTGSIVVASEDNFYNGVITVKSVTKDTVVITFKDEEGDDIEAALKISGNTLKGSWKYTDPIFDATGYIDVSKVT